VAEICSHARLVKGMTSVYDVGFAPFAAAMERAARAAFCSHATYYETGRRADCTCQHAEDQRPKPNRHKIRQPVNAPVGPPSQR
jgi:hypothetical protein